MTTPWRKWLTSIDPNVRLKAAAPDLLAALKDMLTLMGPLEHIPDIKRKRKAQAAIDKATGRISHD